MIALGAAVVVVDYQISKVDHFGYLFVVRAPLHHIVAHIEPNRVVGVAGIDRDLVGGVAEAQCLQIEDAVFLLDDAGSKGVIGCRGRLDIYWHNVYLGFVSDCIVDNFTCRLVL